MTPPIKIDDDVKEAVKKEQSEAINRRYVIPPPKTEMFKPSGHYFQTLLNARLKKKDEQQARLDSSLELLRSTPFIEVMETVARIEKERDQLKQQPLLNIRDGKWQDESGACRVCNGVLPEGHTPECDYYKATSELLRLNQQLLSQVMTIDRMRVALKNVSDESPNADVLSLIDGFTFSYQKNSRLHKEILQAITATPSDTSHSIYERIMSFWSRSDDSDLQRIISFDPCDRKTITKELVEFILSTETEAK